MLSCSEFTGVPLVTLLEMSGADWTKGRFVLAELLDIAGGLQLTFRVTLEVEGQERPACIAESVVRQYFEAQVPPKP
jgi:hypothetical protein